MVMVFGHQKLSKHETSEAVASGQLPDLGCREQHGEAVAQRLLKSVFWLEV